MLYPFGLKKKLSGFAALLSVSRSDFNFVTVKKQKYYVYRYEGKLNGIENAVVLLSYPEKAFGNPKALRAFLSTNVSMTTDEILSYYVCRWPIEIFFRQCKNKLALDNYQIRSSKGIQRYHQISNIIQLEKYRYLFQCAKASSDFDSFMKLAV